MSDMRIEAPSFAKRIEVSRPIPPPAPVMTAFLPARRPRGADMLIEKCICVYVKKKKRTGYQKVIKCLFVCLLKDGSTKRRGDAVKEGDLKLSYLPPSVFEKLADKIRLEVVVELGGI
jgi:hypothetical protein